MTNEEVIEVLEKEESYMLSHGGDRQAKALRIAIDKIEQEPRWIPVTERLPEEIFGCLVTVWDANPKTGEEFENILPEFVGYDGETWNGADGKPIAFEVIAWMPLPEPYKEDKE